MEDKNTKLLIKILVFLLIIIGIIIILFLSQYVLKIGTKNVVLPKTTTKASIDNDANELSDGQRLDYNEKLYNKTFLLSLENAIDNNYKYKSSNLLKSESSIFRYVFVKESLEKNKEILTLSELNESAKNIFNKDLTSDNITEYLTEDGYKYSFNNSNPKYCLKATKEKNNGSEKTIFVDLIDYNSAVCNTTFLDYTNKVVKHKAYIKLKTSDNKFFINSFIII